MISCKAAGAYKAKLSDMTGELTWQGTVTVSKWLSRLAFAPPTPSQWLRNQQA
jgi:hypothetical protein